MIPDEAGAMVVQETLVFCFSYIYRSDSQRNEGQRNEEGQKNEGLAKKQGR